MAVIQIGIYSLDDGCLMYANGNFVTWYFQESPTVEHLREHFGSNPIQIFYFDLNDKFQKKFRGTSDAPLNESEIKRYVA